MTEQVSYDSGIVIEITRRGGHSTVVLVGICLNRVQVSVSECQVVVMAGFLTEGN